MRPALWASLSLLSLLPSAFTASVKPPSLDSWYSQPKNISDYETGAVIRSRTVNSKLEAFLTLPVDVDVKSVVQYLYRTTDSLGKAAASVVTLIEPKKSDPTKLLGYQIYYDSANIDSSPSYLLRTLNSTLNIYEPDIALIGAALNQGWWVYTTDYEGLDAQYTAGLQSGHAVLDSTRAVLKEAPSMGLSKNPHYALWGYSGGALASSWAAEIQTSYAPELNFSGVALGGTVPNITSITLALNNGSNTGILFSGFYGTAKAFPNMTEWLNENLIPSKSAEFYNIANGSLNYATAAGANKDIFSFFKGGEKALLDAVPQSVFRYSGSLGLHGYPVAPLYVYKAVGDELSPVKDTDKIVAKYCAQGARIQYDRDVIGDHTMEGISGSVNALSWISDRLSGKSVDDGCSTNVVAILSLDQKGVSLLGKKLYAAFSQFLVLFLDSA